MVEGKAEMLGLGGNSKPQVIPYDPAILQKMTMGV
jgi:hypothetical protein